MLASKLITSGKRDILDLYTFKKKKTVSKPVSPVNIRKEVKQATDEQVRINNLIVYRVAYAMSMTRKTLSGHQTVQLNILNLVVLLN